MATQENILAHTGTSRGVSRVFQKLQASIEAGNFYEAHQMYRTLYFRFMAHSKYKDALDLIYEGAQKMAGHQQFCSSSDLGLLAIDTLETMGNAINSPEFWMSQLAQLMEKIGPHVVERETLLERSLKWSASKTDSPGAHPTMHKCIAQVMYNERNYPQARFHYIRAKDSSSCARLLLEFSQSKGFNSEVDLFIAQTVLQQLCLQDAESAIKTFSLYCKYHPKIACTQPPLPTPLLNFVLILLQMIKDNDRDFDHFRSLRSLYKPSLDRDLSYGEHLDKIGKIYFNSVEVEIQQNIMLHDLLERFLFAGDGEPGDEEIFDDHQLHEINLDEIDMDSWNVVDALDLNDPLDLTTVTTFPDADDSSEAITLANMIEQIVFREGIDSDSSTESSVWYDTDDSDEAITVHDVSELIYLLDTSDLIDTSDTESSLESDSSI